MLPDLSHMAYPVGAVENGPCPVTHPKRVMTLYYEVKFRVQDYPYRNNSLTFSFGDQSGLGYHADFVSDWDTAVLADAIVNVSRTAIRP